MDVRDLRSFVTVARTGSFTAAAAELGYTQSAISQQIGSLERSLGHALLTRRPVALTPAGSRLLEHATHILRRVDVATSELSHADAPLPRRVAVSPLADLRDALAPGHAGPAVIVDADPAGAIELLTNGTVDVAVVAGVVVPGTPLFSAEAGLFRTASIVEEPVVVIVPDDHPLRVRAADPDTFTDALWIDTPAMAPIAIANRSSHTTYEGTDTTVLLDLVAAGLGLAILPARCVPGRDDLRSIELDPTRLVLRTESLTLQPMPAA